MTPAAALIVLATAAEKAGGFDPTLLVALISAVVALVGGYLSYRATTKANATSDRKVDLEEYRDQQNRYKEMMAEQDRHIDRIRAQLDRVQDQLAKEQDVSNALRNEIRALQGQVDLLSAARRAGTV